MFLDFAQENTSYVLFGEMLPILRKTKIENSNLKMKIPSTPKQASQKKVAKPQEPMTTFKCVIKDQEKASVTAWNALKNLRRRENNIKSIILHYEDSEFLIYVKTVKSVTKEQILPETIILGESAPGFMETNQEIPYPCSHTS